MARSRRRGSYRARSSKFRRVKAHTRGPRGPKKGKRVRVKSYKRGRPDPSSYPRHH